MKFIVGLGNPETLYSKHRHNVGFFCVDALRKHFGFGDFVLKKTFQAEISEGVVGDEKLMLVKPQTFMNQSGDAIARLRNFYGLHQVPNDFWVFYDDIDLEFGKFRIREQGSAGTHNGIKSVISVLGSHFVRFRIGIENRDEFLKRKQDLSNYVLSDFRKDEMESLKDVMERLIQAVDIALQEGIIKAKERSGA